MGLDRAASAEEIKTAYRRLARKYHPDVSKEKDAEERFKELAEAYETLRDPDKRAAYDRLGDHRAGQEFRPPPDWERRYGDFGSAFDDIDLSDLFANFSGAQGQANRGRGKGTPIAGEDYEVTAEIGLEDAFRGAEITLNLALPEYDPRGFFRREPKPLKIRIPKGATEGQRLRLPGKGGKGVNGGENGTLYIAVRLRPHEIFRVNGHDLYMDLPLAPWEAVLGATVEAPTLAGGVRLKIPPGARAGQQLRIAGRGLPKPRSGAGDLFAILQIVVPATPSEREKALFQELARCSGFNPRAHFERSK